MHLKQGILSTLAKILCALNAVKNRRRNGSKIFNGKVDKEYNINAVYKHPQYKMSYGWLDCCRLTVRVFQKFGKLLKQDPKHPVAGPMIFYSGLVKHYYLKAFKADYYDAILKAFDNMKLANVQCNNYHYEAERIKLYENFAEGYKIRYPLHSLRFEYNWQKARFKDIYFPRKAHIRLKDRHTLRLVRKYNRMD